jgi:hypothetical protein
MKDSMGHGSEKGAVLPRRPLAERFWAKVDRRGPDECWPWLGCKRPLGYGSFSVSSYRTVGAHRVAYELAHGATLPSKSSWLCIDHLCRTPSCVNPRHLELVTYRENTLRGDTIPARHLAKTHCPRGHPLSGANLYLRMRPGTRLLKQRCCRLCRRMSNRLDKARKRAAR